MSSLFGGRAYCVGLVSLLLFATLSACTNDRDVRGTYDVELRIQRIGVPIHGVLVLGSRSLEVSDPVWIVPNKPGGGEIADDDDLLLDANSCLVLTRPGSEAPRAVMLFEIRSRSDGIEFPFGIFDGGRERIEVADFSLFADALSGDLVYTDANGTGEGRLYGDRTGDPDGETCLLALARFVEALAAGAGAGTGTGTGTDPTGDSSPR